MTKIPLLSLLLGLTLFAKPASQSVILAWDTPAPGGNQGVVITMTAPGRTNVWDIGNRFRQYQIPGLSRNTTYTFWAQAYYTNNPALRSERSATLFYTTPK